jgi:hypothetical protein
MITCGVCAPIGAPICREPYFFMGKSFICTRPPGHAFEHVSCRQATNHHMRARWSKNGKLHIEAPDWVASTPIADPKVFMAELHRILE